MLLFFFHLFVFKCDTLDVTVLFLPRALFISTRQFLCTYSHFTNPDILLLTNTAVEGSSNRIINYKEITGLRSSYVLLLCINRNTSSLDMVP